MFFLKKAFELLIEKELIKESNNQILIEKVPDIELWKVEGHGLIQIDDRDNADIILNRRDTLNITDKIKSVGMFPPFIRTSDGMILWDIRHH